MPSLRAIGLVNLALLANAQTPSLSSAIIVTSPLTGIPATGSRACNWPFVLTVQERNGSETSLTGLVVTTPYPFIAPEDRSSEIQQLFGTTRLAPFGTLRGTLCFPAGGGPQFPRVQFSGTNKQGAVSASIEAFLSVHSAPGPSQPSFSPPSLTLSPADPNHVETATLSLHFANAGMGPPDWNATLTPLHRNAGWLKVTPLAGTGDARLNVEASAAGLSPGAYSALVSVSSLSTIPQVVDALVTLEVGASGSMKITGLQNALSFASSFAPGMLMSVYGDRLAPGTQKADSLPLPFTINGVSATVNGVPAPLHLVSPGQVNLQAPYETGLGPAVVAINNNGIVTSKTFPVSVTAPGLLPSAADPFTGALVSTAEPGQLLLLFMTGEGDVTPALSTGTTPSSDITDPGKLPKARLPVSVTVGGVPAGVDFAGIPNGLAGISQINFTIPATVPPGRQAIIVTVGSSASPPLLLTVIEKVIHP